MVQGGRTVEGTRRRAMMADCHKGEEVKTRSVCRSCQGDGASKPHGIGNEGGRGGRQYREGYGSRRECGRDGMYAVA